MPVIEWFAYCFPNRRSDKNVVEITLDFTPSDRDAGPGFVSGIRSTLIKNGILAEDEVFPAQPLPGDRMEEYAALLLEIALLFQRKAGHQVSFYSIIRDPGQNRVIALLEHEHCDVGMTAVKLAVEMIKGQRRHLAGPFQVFAEFARERLLPADTGAIKRAALRRGIPVVQLERQPYRREQFEDVTGGECIRQNGLLILGFGASQHILDGTFCIDKSKKHNNLRKHRQARRALLKKLGIALFDPGDRNALDLKKYHLVVVNGKITAVVDPAGVGFFPPANLKESITAFARKLNHELGHAPIVMSLLTDDLTGSPAMIGGGVLDFELAPEIDNYLDPGRSQHAELIDSTADQVVEWLFPDSPYVRMPVVAITGTNGKTTTTRMVQHILKSAGLKPGMVCTDGVFLNGQQVSKADECADTGHLKVLTSKAVDAAVLETHHAGIAVRGFAFDWCDIAICLNVSDDHQGTLGIETIEQMAKVKQALPERARKAVVLNADDPHCLAMLGSVTAKRICLVSTRLTVEELRVQVSREDAFLCVLETCEGQEWLVFYDHLDRIPVMTSASIPATFDGAARFNVSNAMHAMVAARLLGISVPRIRAAMGNFQAGSEQTPGRLNIFDQLPFRIIMDFAHNPDGITKLCEFIDQQKVTGRKLIAFAGPASRKDEIIRNIGRAVAGHFDFYICKEYAPKPGVEKRKVAHLLAQGLRERGVAEDQIAITSYGKDVMFEIFASCEAGDLLVALMGHVEKQELPAYISEYAAINA